MIDEAVKGTVEGLSEAARKWWEIYHKDRQPMKILDDMLRNPHWRFREASRLAAAIGDKTPDHEIAVALLKHMGARHNVSTQGSDTWTMDKYWEEDLRGTWKLRKGVEPGQI